MSKQKNFVGIDNFAKLLTDRKVKAAFINSYRYLVPIVIICFICGLIVALLVSQLPEKIKGFVAVLFFYTLFNFWCCNIGFCKIFI